MTLDPDDKLIRFMRIYAGVLWRMARQTTRGIGLIENIGIQGFNTLGNEAKIIMYYYVGPII